VGRNGKEEGMKKDRDWEQGGIRKEVGMKREKGGVGLELRRKEGTT
jgi:hypothetical protein